MQAGQYLSDYLEEAEKNLKRLEATKDRKAMKIFIDRVKQHAMYFVLDNHGDVAPDEELTNAGVTDPDFLRPPFDVCVLAYEARVKDGTTRPTLIFIDRYGESDEAIFYYSTNHKHSGWATPNLFWEVPFDGSMLIPDGKGFKIAFAAKYALDHEFSKVAEGMGLPIDEAAQKHAQFSVPIFLVYTKFCAVLSRNEVIFTDTVPDKATNQMRRARGKAPLFTYKTLTIGEPKKQGHGKGGGTHASPRPHMRRGHYRALKSGKRVWVESTMVIGNGEGFAHKDYKVVTGVMQ